MSGGSVVELSGVGRHFAGPPAVQALTGVDLRVQRGDYLSLVGPSGSGKSTLLNVLGLLDRPSVGSYRLDGVATTDLPEGRRAALRAAGIGFVFQAFHLLPHRRVLDNVLLAMLWSGVPRREREDRAREALDRVGLTPRVEAYPGTLSGGERQRVAIARAVAHAPALLLADEPTGNLDRAMTQEVLDVFDELHGRGLTLVVITHDDDVAQRAQRTLVMADGTLVTP